MADLVASVMLSLKTLLVLRLPWNTKVPSLMVVLLDLIYHKTIDVEVVVVVSVAAEAVASAAAEVVALAAAEAVALVAAEVVVSVVAEVVASVVVGVVTVVVGVVAAALEVDLPVASSLPTKARCKSGAELR